MPVLPTLCTARLVLRPFTLADAAEVQRLAGDIEVASTTATIPHPYLDGMAEGWISTLAGMFARGEALTLAVTEHDRPVGAMTLRLEPHQRRAELGYWVGRPSWGRGIATEAAAAIVNFGFAELKLHRIYASYFTRNPASARVMEKLGMLFEGVQREHFWRDGRVEDVGRYAILAREWIYLPA